jgi:hypothetical protein
MQHAPKRSRLFVFGEGPNGGGRVWVNFNFIGLAYQGKDIVFRFIIEYSSLRDFGPYVVGLFWYKDIWKMIFLLVLKLGISYKVKLSWRILVSFRRIFLKIIFLHGEIFEFPSFFFCLNTLFNVNCKTTVWHTPCFLGGGREWELTNLSNLLDFLQIYTCVLKNFILFWQVLSRE